MLIAFESGFAKLKKSPHECIVHDRKRELVSQKSFKNNYTVELASQEDAPNLQVIKRKKTTVTNIFYFCN